METEPCDLLIRKIKEHNAVTMCPYCKQLFDIHTGMIFLEGKNTENSSEWGHDHFIEVMSNEVDK